MTTERLLRLCGVLRRALQVFNARGPYDLYSSLAHELRLIEREIGERVKAER